MRIRVPGLVTSFLQKKCRNPRGGRQREGRGWKKNHGKERIQSHGTTLTESAVSNRNVAMFHTPRHEAGRRGDGWRKCTIQITIKVRLYIPREDYGAPCYEVGGRRACGWVCVRVSRRLYHFVNCSATEKGEKNKIKLWGMKNFGASVIFLVTVQEKVRPRVILKAEN